MAASPLTTPRPDARSALDTARDQLDELVRQWPSSGIGGMIVAAMVAWVFWDVAASVAMAGWLAAIVASNVARFVLWRGMKHRGWMQHDPRRGLLLFTVLAAAQAAIWGSAGIIFFAADSPHQLSFLAIMLLSVAAANQSLLNAYAPAALLGVALMALPFAAMMLLTGDEFLTPLGILCVVFVGVLFSLTKRSNRTLVSNMRLRHELSRELVRRDQIEQELAVAKNQAEAAARAKSQFLANMSHEIRTPLNGVLGMAELLAQSDLSASQSRRVQIIRGSGQTLMTVINDILDLSKIEVGKVVLENVPFDLRSAVTDVVELFAETASARSVLLAATFSDDLPRAVSGDPTRLRQILTNLVSNAVKFTNGGGRVDIRTTTIAQNDECISLTFEVEDTGVGIEQAQLDRLFEPFEQADSSTSRRYGGTGLGLAIVAGLADAMGGRIEARSEVGRGSTFVLSVAFPIATEHAPTEPDGAADGEKGADTLFSATVLLAEDNAVNQEVACEALSQLGCDVIVAIDGLDAFEKWKAAPLDLILMDCQMPQMDGLETTAMIRTQEKQKGTGGRIPIIALTAHVLEEDRQRCLGVGMDDFLSKPFDLASLQSILERWLPPSRSADRQPRVPSAARR